MSDGFLAIKLIVDADKNKWNLKTHLTNMDTKGPMDTAAIDTHQNAQIQRNPIWVESAAVNASKVRRQNVRNKLRSFEFSFTSKPTFIVNIMKFWGINRVAVIATIGRVTRI